MNELLQEIVGWEVWLWTTSSPSYLGTVEAAGNRWVNITAVGGNLLLPITNIRLIKVTGGGMAAHAATGELSPSLIGRKVTIISVAGESPFTDTGELEAFDDDWLRIHKKNDQLYFPVSSIAEIRLIPE